MLVTAMMSCHDILSSVPVQNLTAPSAIPPEVGLPTCFPAEDLFLLSCSFFFFIYLSFGLFGLHHFIPKIPKAGSKKESAASVMC